MTSQFVTYKTTLIADSYLLIKNNRKVGKLNKSARYGSVIEASLYDTKISFKAKGYVNPTVEIIDKINDKKIGTIKIDNSFVIFPKAKLVAKDGSEYYWQSNGIFNYSWEWKSGRKSKPLLSSMESYNISNKVGQIASHHQFINKELLVVSGLYLRDFVNRGTLIKKIFLLILSILMLRLYFVDLKILFN